MRIKGTPVAAKTSGRAIALAVALVMAGVSTIALADDDRLDEAWADAVDGQEPFLSDKQFARLNNLAFQAAVTKICDGYELDDAKFSEGLVDATSPAPEGMTDAEAEQWRTAVFFRLGTTYGLFLAEGNAASDDFCESAGELKADAEVPNVWQ